MELKILEILHIIESELNCFNVSIIESISIRFYSGFQLSVESNQTFVLVLVLPQSEIG